MEDEADPDLHGLFPTSTPMFLYCKPEEARIIPGEGKSNL